jgi:hypothetical protein
MRLSLSAPRSSRRPERTFLTLLLAPPWSTRPSGTRTPLLVCGGHSQEVRRLFAGWLCAPTRKKSKEYHGTLDLCRLPGGQMAKVELEGLFCELRRDGVFCEVRSKLPSLYCLGTRKGGFAKLIQSGQKLLSRRPSMSREGQATRTRKLSRGPVSARRPAS